MTSSSFARNANTNKKRTNKMLLAVVAYFSITWTPYHVYFITSELNKNLVTGRYLTLVDLLLRVVALSSSCVNPFLYGWLNANYRAAFLDIIRRPLSSIRNIRFEKTKKAKIINSTDVMETGALSDPDVKNRSRFIQETEQRMTGGDDDDGKGACLSHELELINTTISEINTPSRPLGASKTSIHTVLQLVPTSSVGKDRNKTNDLLDKNIIRLTTV